MDEDKQRRRLIAMAQNLAMQALELPPDKRQNAIVYAVGKIRRDYERKHGANPDTAEQARKLLELTRAMVKILEESGGTIGHA